MNDLHTAIQFEQPSVCHYDEVKSFKGIDFNVQLANTVDDFKHLFSVA